MLGNERTANYSTVLPKKQLQDRASDMARESTMLCGHPIARCCLGSCENILVLERGQIAAAGPGADILPAVVGTDGPVHTAGTKIMTGRDHD